MKTLTHEEVIAISQDYEWQLQFAGDHPIYMDEHGTLRYAIVGHYDNLFKCGALDLNKLSVAEQLGDFSLEDRMDIYRCIGYSLSGFDDCFYDLEETRKIFSKQKIT